MLAGAPPILKAEVVAPPNTLEAAVPPNAEEVVVVLTLVTLVGATVVLPLEPVEPDDVGKLVGRP